MYTNFPIAVLGRIVLGSTDPPQTKKETPMDNKKTDDESRREFLIKAGKLAVYTPPALMLLMRPSRTVACTSAGGKRPDYQWNQIHRDR
jgi:hypothetical protein